MRSVEICHYTQGLALCHGNIIHVCISEPNEAEIPVKATFATLI